jgi:hypothetical protein
MWSIAIPPDVRSQMLPFLLSDSNFVPSSRCAREFKRSSVKSYRFFYVQTLKSRLQSAPQGTYKGFIDCAKKTIAADGVGALWKGKSQHLIMTPYRLSLSVSTDTIRHSPNPRIRTCYVSSVPCQFVSSPSIRPPSFLAIRVILTIPTSNRSDAATFLGYELAVKGMESFGF